MMSKIIQFFKLYRSPLLAGILVGTSYIPFPAWAAWFCFVPLWLFATDPGHSLKQVFWGSWLTQFILSLIGFHWVAHLTHEFGHFPWVLTVPILVAFCSLVHLFIPLLNTLCIFIGRKLRLSRSYLLILLALFHNLGERLWPSLFPWNMGYTIFSSHFPIYQWADTIGILGLSLVVLLINAGLAIWWLRREQRLLAALAGILVVLNISGFFHARSWPSPDRSISAVVVQANIGNFEKIQAEKGEAFQDHIIEKFLSLSEKGLRENPEGEILIWPETAFPYYLNPKYLSQYFPQKLLEGLRPLARPLITGSYSKEMIGPKERPVSYNALAFIDEKAQVKTPLYHKTHLLAFGEYVPLSETFPIILKWVPMSNFGRGQGPQSFPLPVKGEDIMWGPQICYEGLYPQFSRELAREGAEIFVNVTNDSWFGQPFEPQQHMYMTFARAIENRRPLLRATNTGISSAILASGEILNFSPLHQEWVGLFKIPFLKNPPLTFFSKWGHLEDIILPLIILLTLALGFYHARTDGSGLDRNS